MFDPARLLHTGRRDFAHDVGHAFDRLHDIHHRRARALDQAGARLDAVTRRLDQALDFLGRRRAALRQRADLACHHGKAAALLASAGGFDRCVERQDVRLKGDAVDDRQDIGDFLRRRGDVAHRRHDLLHHVATARRGLRRGDGELAGGSGVFGILFDHGGQLFHARRCLLQRRRLRFRTLREVGVAFGNLVSVRVNGFRTLAHRADRAGETVAHPAEGTEQLTHLVTRVLLDALAQIAGGHPLEMRDGVANRTQHGAREHGAAPQREEQRNGQGCPQGDAHDVVAVLGHVESGLLPRDLDLLQLAHGRVERRIGRRGDARLNLMEPSDIALFQGVERRRDDLIEKGAALGVG